MLRAYEVFESTGRPLAEWQDAPGEPVLKDAQLARLRAGSAARHAARAIAERFEKMLEAGGLEEARALEGLDPACRPPNCWDCARFRRWPREL